MAGAAWGCIQCGHVHNDVDDDDVDNDDDF